MRGLALNQVKELTLNQEKAIDMMLSGIRQTKIASELGVNKNTISAWKKEPEFKEALKQRTDEIRDEWRVSRRKLLAKNFELLLAAFDDKGLDVVRLTSAAAKLAQQTRIEFDDLPSNKSEITVEKMAPLIQIDGELWNAI